MHRNAQEAWHDNQHGPKLTAPLQISSSRQAVVVEWPAAQRIGLERGRWELVSIEGDQRCLWLTAQAAEFPGDVYTMGSLG